MSLTYYNVYGFISGVDLPLSLKDGQLQVSGTTASLPTGNATLPMAAKYNISNDPDVDVLPFPEVKRVKTRKPDIGNNVFVITAEEHYIRMKKKSEEKEREKEERKSKRLQKRKRGGKCS